MACADYRPDHNGECLNCDDWADAHDLPTLPESWRTVCAALDRIADDADATAILTAAKRALWAALMTRQQ